MLYRREDKKKLLKAGAFLSFLCLILMVMIISIGKENSFFEPKSVLKARVENVSNLQPGSYVELRGIKIGTVERIEIISDEEVEISMRVLTSQLKWVKKDAQISIATAGLVGDKFLEIIPGNKETESINSDKDILSIQKREIFNELVSKSGSIAASTENILTRLEVLISSNQFENFISSIHKTSQNLEILTHELSKTQISDSIKSINQTAKKLDTVLNQVEKGPGTLHSLIFDDSLHDDLRALLGGAQRNKIIKYFIRESIKNSETN